MTDTKPTHADWIGRTVHGANGEKIGDVTNVYADDVTGRPDWMTVSTGWFGSSEQFVPIQGTKMNGDDLQIAFGEDTVKDAPSIDGDKHLDADDERRLYSHYGMDYDSAQADTDVERADEGYAYSDNRDADRRTAGNGSDQSVTRSEEELSVDKSEHDAGTARLKKYVVTEDVTMTVPVRKEVARITRTDVEAGDGVKGGTIADGESVEEITLKEEQIDIDKNVVEKERVGIETETVTEDRQVSETVRKEQVDVEGDVQKN